MNRFAYLFLISSLFVGCAQSSGGGSAGQKPNDPNQPPVTTSEDPDFTRFPRTYYRPLLGIAPKITVELGKYIDDIDIKKAFVWEKENENTVFGCLENSAGTDLTMIMKEKGTPLKQNLMLKVSSSSGFHENTTGTMFPYRYGVKTGISGYYDQSGQTFDSINGPYTDCYFEAKKRDKVWGGNIFCKNVKTAQGDYTNFLLHFDCEFLKN